MGDTARRGDAPGEMGDSLPAVDLGTGRTAIAMTAGYEHTCALLDNGSVKCWGDSPFGELGRGDRVARGDGPGEMGNALSPVDLGTGRTAVAVEAGGGHTCALLDNGTAKCWGNNTFGQLGLDDTSDRGDEPGEMGDVLTAVDLGTGHKAVQMTAGTFYTCSLLNTGTVKCWGDNRYGQLGLGNRTPQGARPGDMGDALLVVDLGGVQVAVVRPHKAVLPVLSRDR